MSETIYAVQFIINGRSGSLPSVFNLESDAISYARLLDRLNRDHDVKTEVRVYECKEISYK
jgi:hypothetical protein